MTLPRPTLPRPTAAPHNAICHHLEHPGMVYFTLLPIVVAVCIVRVSITCWLAVFECLLVMF